SAGCRRRIIGSSGRTQGALEVKRPPTKAGASSSTPKLRPLMNRLGDGGRKIGRPRTLLHAKEMVQRQPTGAGGISLPNGLSDVGFSEHDRVVEVPAERQVGGDRR